VTHRSQEDYEGEKHDSTIPAPARKSAKVSKNDSFRQSVKNLDINRNSTREAVLAGDPMVLSGKVRWIEGQYTDGRTLRMPQSWRESFRAKKRNDASLKATDSGEHVSFPLYVDSRFIDADETDSTETEEESNDENEPIVPARVTTLSNRLGSSASEDRRTRSVKDHVEKGSAPTTKTVDNTASKNEGTQVSVGARNRTRPNRASIVNLSEILRAQDANVSQTTVVVHKEPENDSSPTMLKSTHEDRPSLTRSTHSVLARVDSSPPAPIRVESGVVRSQTSSWNDFGLSENLQSNFKRNQHSRTIAQSISFYEKKALDSEFNDEAFIKMTK